MSKNNQTQTVPEVAADVLLLAEQKAQTSMPIGVGTRLHNRGHKNRDICNISAANHFGSYSSRGRGSLPIEAFLLLRNARKGHPQNDVSPIYVDRHNRRYYLAITDAFRSFRSMHIWSVLERQIALVALLRHHRWCSFWNIRQHLDRIHIGISSFQQFSTRICYV